MSSKRTPVATIAMVATVCFVLLSSACGLGAQPSVQTTAQQPTDQPKYGGTLVLLNAASGDPPSLDTHQESTGATTQFAHPGYDNLIRFDFFKPDEIVPDLAERWEVSPDGKSYTFFLHKGVTFHYGQPFTSADVKFTLERIKDPPKGMVSPRRDQFTAVSSIETPDVYTVKINLSRPNPSLLAALAQGVMPIYSKQWIDEKGNDIPKKEINGTGPFKFKDYVRATSSFMERNPNYWVKGLPYLDGVQQFYIDDPNTRLAAFRTGKVMLIGLDPGAVEEIKRSLGDQVQFYRNEGEGFTAFMANSKRKPYDDPRVREALNLALDRQAAIQVVAQGAGVLGGYMKGEGMWGLSQEELLKQPGYGKDKTKDLERAKKLLADAGYPNGFEAALIVRKTGTDALGVYTVDQMKKLGLNVNMKITETAVAYDMIRDANYDMLVWGFGYSLEDPDAIYSEFVLCDSPRNWTYVCTPEVDALYQKQTQEVDLAKRKALVQEMEQKAIPSTSKMILYRSAGTTAVYKYVKGYIHYAATRNNQRFRDAWLDK